MMIIKNQKKENNKLYKKLFKNIKKLKQIKIQNNKSKVNKNMVQK